MATHIWQKNLRIDIWNVLEWFLCHCLNGKILIFAQAAPYLPSLWLRHSLIDPPGVTFVKYMYCVNYSYLLEDQQIEILLKGGVWSHSKGTMNPLKLQKTSLESKDLYFVALDHIILFNIMSETWHHKQHSYTLRNKDFAKKCGGVMFGDVFFI